MKRSIFAGALCLLLGVACGTTKPPAPSRSTANDTSTNDLTQEEVNNMVLAIFQEARHPAIRPCVNEIPPAAFTPKGKLEQEQTFRDYTIRIYQDNDTGEGYFEILRNKQRIYAQEGVKFQVGATFGESNQESPLPMGLNITGYAPNLVVQEFTMGAHCCFWYHIFEIGKSFRPIAAIPAADGIAEFKDVDNDGSLEIILYDWTYAYQFTCFAGSPAVEVILRYRDGSYFVDPKLMRKPAPAIDELEKKAREIQARYEAEKANPAKWGSPVDLWDVMLNLTYAGHEDLAVRLFDLAWPSGIEGKKEALARFKKLLNQSPFYREMRAMEKQQGVSED